MGVLARLYNFTAHSTIQSAQINSEFNQIVQMLSGTYAGNSLRLYNQFNSDYAPVMRLNQLNLGNITEYYQNSVLKGYISNIGQLGSALATGTAPMSITSTTRVPLLNAAYIDDIPSSALMNYQAAGNFIKGVKIKKASTGTDEAVVSVDNNIFNLNRSSDNASLLTINSLNSSPIIHATLNTLIQLNYVPTSPTDVIRKTEYDNIPVKTLSFSSGTLVPALNKIMLLWIAPSSQCVITRIKMYVYGDYGSAGNADIYTIYKNNVSKGTMTMTQGSIPASRVMTFDITDIPVAEGDIIKITCTQYQTTRPTIVIELHGTK